MLANNIDHIWSIINYSISPLEAQQKELEKLANPIIMKMYQQESASMPTTDTTNNSEGPKIEEVDD